MKACCNKPPQILKNMIRYIPHSQIDFEKWDHCIEGSVNGIFYAYAWYLDMVSPGWDALVENDYQSVMPLPHRTKSGVTYLYQPFFIQQMGVFSAASLTSQVTDRFLKAIPPQFKYVNFNLNTYNQIEDKSQFKISSGQTHHLDLIEPYKQLKKRYSENNRRNIKKAEKNGVFITSHGRPEDIISAFRQYRGKQLRSFSEEDYNVLKHIIYAGIHRGMATIMTAYSAENTFCGGVVFFKSHKKVVFLFSGSTPLARKNGAMFLLVDAFIKQMAGQDLVLDFEGSSQPELARFYKGFGSKECVFLQLEKNNLPFGIKQLAGLYLWFRKKQRSS